MSSFENQVKLITFFILTKNDSMIYEPLGCLVSGVRNEFKNLMIYLVGSLMCFWSWKPRAPIGDPLVFGILVGVQAAAGLCVSLVLKYCDNVIKGFSTSAAVNLARSSLISNLRFSSSTSRIRALVPSSTIRGPRVRSPKQAVSLTS